ncbi:MAG: GrpB family protein [Solirubrobacterales bacterium]
MGDVEAGDDLDGYLDGVLIGGREEREIRMVDYDDEWPRRFEAERQRIQAAIGSSTGRIEHIGSTAVPGLAAKPVVDVMISVEDPADESAYVPQLEAAGYVLRVREAGHRMLRTPAKDVHLHVWVAGSDDERRHLVFRDRLRASEADRFEYDQTKPQLIGHWRDMNHYAQAKDAVITRIMRRADGEPAEDNRCP